MIESKFTFLQMQVEGSFVDSSESEQMGFRKAPESYNPVHMLSVSHKFILAMIHAEMFVMPQIDQAIMPSSLIRVDHTFHGDLATKNGLQRGFLTVRNEFSLELANSLKNPKGDGFAIGPLSPFPFDASRTKVRFIGFDLSTKRQVPFTELGETCLHSSPAYGLHPIAILPGQESHL